MTYAQELQSSALPLLLRTPNGRHGVGANREKWILHPIITTLSSSSGNSNNNSRSSNNSSSSRVAASGMKTTTSSTSTSNVQLEMFAFLGKLMGIAIRSKEYLALNIPSIVW